MKAFVVLMLVILLVSYAVVYAIRFVETVMS